MGLLLAQSPGVNGSNPKGSLVVKNGSIVNTNAVTNAGNLLGLGANDMETLMRVVSPTFKQRRYEFAMN